jgi:glutamate N-acetyltransferase / amino-acid N-acetyltransferase
VHVQGGHGHTVERTARAIANSPLVKAALNGGDPNWGRIAQAIGAALPGSAPVPYDIWIDGVQVCAGGVAIPHEPPALGDEVEYVVGLPGEGAETEVFFSDLSHDYVTINAEYTT